MSACKTPTVSSVERSLHVLELIAGSKAGLTLPEISRRLGLPKSSAHCLLITLERCGYLTCNKSTRRFLFSLKLFSLANMALSRIRLREQARPFLHALMNGTGLTVHMAVVDQDEVVLVEKMEHPGLRKQATWLGKRMELHCTGLGKAILGFLSEDEVRAMIQEHGLPRHNENTIPSLRRLREELAEIRRLGYALDDEEDEIGARCIGAPIFDPTGKVIAAVSIAGTVEQITSENLSLYVGMVKQAAASISQGLQQIEDNEADQEDVSEPELPPQAIAQGV